MKKHFIVLIISLGSILGCNSTKPEKNISHSEKKVDSVYYLDAINKSDTVKESENFCVKFFIHNKEYMEQKYSCFIQKNISMTSGPYDDREGYRNLEIIRDTAYACFVPKKNTTHTLEKRLCYGKVNMRCGSIDTSFLVRVTYYVKN